MDTKTKKHFGFTLVELLVVIAILGILVIVITASLTDAKARSRDSRRVSEIWTLQEALNMYLDNHQTYPIQATEIILNGSDAVETALKADSILKSNIVDPLTGQTNGGLVFNYYYISNAAGRSYTIRFCQETTSVQGQTHDCNNQVSQTH
jgi:prepilin-type N-terminal cleavage/methylation domain-containing protein